MNITFNNILQNSTLYGYQIDNNENIGDDNKYDCMLIQGAGGCGKSTMLKEIAVYLHRNCVEFGYTATTGIAAINLNTHYENSLLELLSSDNIEANHKIFGSTLHRYTGIKLGRGTPETIINAMNYSAKKRWRNMEYLIIDEVSMLGAELFDKLNTIGRILRYNEEPFGGVKLILCGDFLQLPPVKDEWLFTSDTWQELSIKYVTLNKPFRYTDPELFSMLNRIRLGEPNDDDINKLQKRHQYYLDNKDVIKSMPIQPTVLLPKRDLVKKYNKVKLDKIKNPEVIVKSVDKFVFTSKIDIKYKKMYIESYKKLLDECIADEITYKIGAQIMLKINLSTESGLVNGSTGVIQDISDTYITVLFSNGVQDIIEKHTWEYVDDRGIFTRTQFPFVLSWAITIHKSQGSTLDSVICNIGSHIFSPGQAYIAISRVRSLDNLYLHSFIPNCIYADTDAINFIKDNCLL